MCIFLKFKVETQWQVSILCLTLQQALHKKRERERERNSSVEGSCDKRRHESLSIKMCVKTCRAVIIQLLLGSRYSGLSTSRDFRSKYTCCHISVPMITCAQTG